MQINLKLDLNEALCLVAAFEKDSESVSVEMIDKAQKVIEKIADQIDEVITGLEAEAEARGDF